MKQTLAKIAVLAVFTLGIVTLIWSHSHKLPEPPKMERVTLKDYEEKRARLYDAALNLLLEVKECNDKGLNDDWLDIDESRRYIIENYRVPGLNVLLRAIEDLESAPYKELADAYDWKLQEYDEALKEYNEAARSF